MIIKYGHQVFEVNDNITTKQQEGIIILALFAELPR